MNPTPSFHTYHIIVICWKHQNVPYQSKVYVIEVENGLNQIKSQNSILLNNLQANYSKAQEKRKEGIRR